MGQLIKMLVRQREAISPWGSFLARQPTSVTSEPPALTGSPVLSLKKIKANSPSKVAPWVSLVSHTALRKAECMTT